MSGKLCPHHDIRDSKAYCEGRLANKNGELVGTNPHVATSPAGVAWIAGFDSYEEEDTNPRGNDCCGAGNPAGAGYTPPSGD